jgi:hypothetical protein
MVSTEINKKLKQYYFQHLGTKKKGLKNSLQRNSVRLQCVKISKEESNDSEDIKP